MMLLSTRIVVVVVVLLCPFLGLVLAQDDNPPGKIDCYSWTDQIFSNNTQCSGSRICCQTADLCDPNRFCVQDDQYVVPACSVYPWDDCANICQYDPGTGFLPRAVKCNDGSFCCDNDPSCCSEDRGIVLNGLGAIVSTDSSSEPTSTSSTITAATTMLSTPASADATPSSIATPPPSSSSSSGLSTGAKAGIGIGTTVAAITIIVLGAFLVIARRRQRAKTTQALQPLGGKMPRDTSGAYPHFDSGYSDQPSQISELEGMKRRPGTELYELPAQHGSKSIQLP